MYKTPQRFLVRKWILCREVIDDGHDGLLCKLLDADDLVERMELMLSLTDEQRCEMGQRGREKMEREFDEQIVIQKYLANQVG